MRLATTTALSASTVSCGSLHVLPSEEMYPTAKPPSSTIKSPGEHPDISETVHDVRTPGYINSISDGETVMNPFEFMTVNTEPVSVSYIVSNGFLLI